MNIIEGDYKSKDGKDYFYAVINKNKHNIQIFKNFSCLASIFHYIMDEFKIERPMIHFIYNMTFLGDSIDLNKIPKKYSKFEII